jgi:hypothetical protein
MRLMFAARTHWMLFYTPKMMSQRLVFATMKSFMLSNVIAGFGAVSNTQRQRCVTCQTFCNVYDGAHAALSRSNLLHSVSAKAVQSGWEISASCGCVRAPAANTAGCMRCCGS